MTIFDCRLTSEKKTPNRSQEEIENPGDCRLKKQIENQEKKSRKSILRIPLKKEEVRRWSAEIPALPGCSSWGYSQQEALANMKDAADVYIEDMTAVDLK